MSESFETAFEWCVGTFFLIVFSAGFSGQLDSWESEKSHPWIFWSIGICAIALIVVCLGAFFFGEGSGFDEPHDLQRS